MTDMPNAIATAAPRQKPVSAPRKPQKADRGTPGVKAFIAAAALAATLGGWALLAQEEPPRAEATDVVAAPALPTSVDLPPIPTVVPLARSAGAGATPELPPAQPRVAAPPPALRVLTAPQPAVRRAPLAITRSSR